MGQQPLPYWRLSSFYLFYFALLGAILPFWGLYIESLGMTAGDIGTLMAIMMVTRIGAPNLWGWVADRTGRRLWVIRIGALLTLLVFTSAFWASTFWQLALLMFGFSFFWNAVLPQFEVITLDALGERRSRYSQIRVWGSIGFIATVVGLGVLFDYVNIHWLVPVLWGLILLIWLTTLAVPAHSIRLPEQHYQGNFWQIVRQPCVIGFFVVTFVVQLSHGPYYTFFSIHMNSFDYSKTEIGLLWALGVVAEVVLFIYMHRLLEWRGARLITLIAISGCALRWLMIALFPEQLWVLLLAQLLHAVTFGCAHAAAISLVHEFFPAQVHGQGQALYSTCGFGLGGALGAYLSGQSWTLFGGSATFMFAAVVSLFGVLVAFVALRPQKILSTG